MDAKGQEHADAGAVDRGGPAVAKPTGKRSRGRPARTGSFRRLDIEIEESTCDQIDRLKAETGARSTVEVIRHLLRVGFYLHKKVREGYSLQMVKGDKTVEVNLL